MREGPLMLDEEYAAGNPLWVARQKVSLDELTAAEGALWWLQVWPQDGTTRLMRQAEGGAPCPVTPRGFSAGGWLHGYGGGSYAVHGGPCWVISGEDSGLYRLDMDTGALDLVLAGDGFLYGDLRACPLGVLAVSGSEDGDELVLADHDGKQTQALVKSAGFLAAPCLREGQLAFLEWDADQMPWDGSRLQVAALAADASVTQATVIAGGTGESVVQPAWGPDGSLYYMSDRSGWWNLRRWDGRRDEAVTQLEDDCAPAPWEAGYRSFAFLPGRRIALTARHGLSQDLVVVEADGATARASVPLTSVKPYLAVIAGRLAVIGSPAAEQPSVFGIDLASAPATMTARVPATPGVRGTAADRLRLPSSDRIPYLLHRPAGETGPVPLIIRAHAGPTDEVRDRLDWTKEFFLAHGFAIAEVAYRGSAGLGRAFRTSLNGHWGTYDVEDCLAVGSRLLAAGVAREGAVFLSGSSAGGYTALQAACAEDSLLTAVTATSAIIDPGSWATTAPRFQRPHARVLAGPAGAVRAGSVRVPVLLMHGRSDAVAPAGDAERLAGDLRERDVRHQALFFDGAGHYLSSPGVLAEALRAELAFYLRLMSLPAAATSGSTSRTSWVSSATHGDLPCADKSRSRTARRARHRPEEVRAVYPAAFLATSHACSTSPDWSQAEASSVVSMPRRRTRDALTPFSASSASERADAGRLRSWRQCAISSQR
jgi:dipeptidyl aminopeptidase/acylaminoacyl peptidase